MIELRWKTVMVEAPGLSDALRTIKVPTRVLQYRQMVDQNVYAGLHPNREPTMGWSDWVTVPDVPASLD